MKNIAVIICFVVIAINCNGQLCVNRTLQSLNDKKIIHKETCWDLEFGIFNPKGEEDTLFLSLVADSLFDGTYDMSIIVCYPKGTKLDSSYLEIGFENHGIETFKPTKLDLRTFYCVQYTVTKEQYFKLKSYKSEYINFHIERNDLPFVDDYTKYLAGFFEQI